MTNATAEAVAGVVAAFAVNEEVAAAMVMPVAVAADNDLPPERCAEVAIDVAY